MVSAVARRLVEKGKLRKNQERVGPGISPLLSDEVYYRNKLLKQVDTLIAETTEHLTNTDINVLQDAYLDQTPLQEVRAMSKALNKTVRVFNRRAEKTAKSYVNRVDRNQRKRFFNQMRQQFGIDVNKLFEQKADIRDTVAAKTNENVNLITNLSDQYKAEVMETLNRHLTTGSRESLIADIQKIQKKSRNRAKLIARDQTNKLYGALNQARQQSLGIEEYEWVTSKDDRVRPDHASKNGKIFKWDDPPKDTGHPGEDIQCRCIARPIIKL